MGVSMLEMQEMFDKKDLSEGKAREWVSYSESAAGNIDAMVASMSGYDGMMKPANFSCVSHGEFTASPAFVSKFGCPKCGAAMWGPHIDIDFEDDDVHPEELAWLKALVLPMRTV